ncbi:helix-turn-helix transcriptional regulator [Paenirhodobacter populi]|uniref:XRE family transcriptional regulator n=1 Tax=Paenirhodobacter populi TaxID=2306993 RepID=A0A443JGB2_9RHOB|nr:helix-turn-helix transcriptional regulator [Sinirhodobacter populi]RWR19491.1 XRE family transcriptional regulator [Sinirhodobacter populi]
MATTELGKELRRIRITEEERLMDMADRLGKSSAFISALERGSKNPPAGFEDTVIKAYNLLGVAAEAIRKAADRSRKAFVIEANSPLARDTASLMARRMDTLSDDELKSIFAILTKKDAK